MKRPTRVPLQLSESLHQRLNAYALAASAAGVGVLALTLPAEGRIVYTQAHHIISKGQSYPIYLNHGGIPDFNLVIGDIISSDLAFYVRGETYNSHIYNAVAITGTSGRGIGVAAALKKGQKIPGKSGFEPIAVLGADNTYLSRYSGNWLPDVKNRYLGMMFLIKGKVHYGWARVSVRSDTHPFRITGLVTGYAYETIANKPIIAGQTHGKDEATLGRLAQGASAVSNGGKP
jgi:hypothetical protein